MFGQNNHQTFLKVLLGPQLLSVSKKFQTKLSDGPVNRRLC